MIQQRGFGIGFIAVFADSICFAGISKQGPDRIGIAVGDGFRKLVCSAILVKELEIFGIGQIPFAIKLAIWLVFWS